MDNFDWNQLGLEPILMSQLQRLLRRDMLLDFHSAGKDPQMDQKVEAAFEKLEGVPFFHGARRLQPMEVFSPPGHGKTTNYKEAARWVAEQLGLNFVERPAENYQPSKKDLLFLIHQSYGETSTINYAGLPDKGETTSSDGTRTPSMTRLLNHRFVMLGMAGKGVLLFDDFANSHPSISALSLSIATERTYQALDLRHCFMGFASNMGQHLDGTHAEQPSTAHVSRLRRLPVQDSLQEWVLREQAAYNDSIGDAMVGEFLTANKTLFWQMAPDSESGVVESFPCPRTWSHLVADMRVMIHLLQHSERSRHPALFQEMGYIARGHVGKKAGEAYATHVRNQLTDAAPLARALMDKGEATPAKVVEEVRSLARAESPAPDLDFQIRLIRALVHNAVADLERKPGDTAQRKQVWHNFHYAVLGTQAITTTKIGDAYSLLARSLSKLPAFAGDLTARGQTLSLEVLREIQTALGERAASYEVDDALVRDGILPALIGSMDADRAAAVTEAAETARRTAASAVTARRKQAA